MKDKLTKEQIALLEKYNIDYNVKTKKELSINIDYVMTDYVDSNDEPTEDFLIIEKLYDEIYKNLSSNVTAEEEKTFISNFGKNVRIIYKNGDIVEGHCETFTRKADSDYDEPELTIATKDGYICVEYNDVKEIIEVK